MKTKVVAYLALALAFLLLLLILASWLITAAMPEVFSRSLLSAEGIRWFFGQFSSNLASPLLVWLLLASVAYGAVCESGIRQINRAEYRQRIAFRLVLLELCGFLAIILLLTMKPHAILLNVMGGLFPSSFSRSIIPYVCFSVVVMSISYGVLSCRLKTVEDVFRILTAGIRSCAPLFLLYILASQLYYSVEYILF